MTKKQIEDFNKLRSALIEITNYQTPDKLRKDDKNGFGLDFEEAIAMAYENIQETAKFAVKHVRIIKK